MKYGVAFLIIAGFILIWATDRGGLALLALWPGLSFFLVGGSYFIRIPAIFGKRSDGSLPMWSWALHLPFLLFTSGVWHLSRLVSRENPYDYVLPDLIVGRRLLPSEFPEGVVNVVDLTSEFPEHQAIVKAHHYLAVPTLDASYPRPEDLYSAIRSLQPGRTLVHCAQGHGRTGLFATLLLIVRKKAGTIDEALQLLKEARPKLDLNRSQRRFLEKLIRDDELMK